MNYSELRGLAHFQPQYYGKWKAEVDAKNEIILAERQLLLDQRNHIGVGDFVVAGNKTFRVAHNWGDSIQLTDGIYGASFYLGDGYVEFSGGLNRGIPIDQFIPTIHRHRGTVWFFSENSAEAHNGYHTRAIFRVWRLLPKTAETAV